MSENFEDKLKNAKEILEMLNNPEITLEQSVKAYQDGIKVLQDASDMLEKAKLDFQSAKK